MPEEEVNSESQEPQEEGKKKGKFKLILLIICVVFCLGIGGTYFFYGDRIMGILFGKPPNENGEKPKEHEKKMERTVGPMLSLEPFLFNIAGNSSKFAKISIGIELKDVKVLEEAKKMTPLIRDNVLSILGSKSTEVLMGVNSRDVIRQEIHNTLKGLFKKPADINAIYITDIIIQ